MEIGLAGLAGQRRGEATPDETACMVVAPMPIVLEELVDETLQLGVAPEHVICQTADGSAFGALFVPFEGSEEVVAVASIQRIDAPDILPEELEREREEEILEAWEWVVHGESMGCRDRFAHGFFAQN